MDHLSRRRVLASVGTVALAGCSGVGDDGRATDEAVDGAAVTDRAPATDPVTAATDGNAGPTGTPIGGDGTVDLGGPPTTGDAAGGSSGGGPPTRAERLPLPMAPSELEAAAVSGGPAKDGIPAIEEPSFVGSADADFLDDGDPVFGIARDGAVKAYPQKILVQHEIVNDVVGEMPVSVTYCPLTGTVQGFERGETTFGVSGRLINNNLVMYDRATEAWWPQILATAIPGPWNEDPPIESLGEIRLVWTSWGRWRERFPETQVLSTDTGYARNYRRDPYGQYNPVAGYYGSERFLFNPLDYDADVHPKRVVIGARTPDGAVAFDKERLRVDRQVAKRIAETPVLAVHDPRFDTAWVYANPEGRAFEFADGRFVDADGTAHPPDDLPLAHVFAFDAMWFAWNGYYPDTTVEIPPDDA